MNSHTNIFFINSIIENFIDLYYMNIMFFIIFLISIFISFVFTKSSFLFKNKMGLITTVNFFRMQSIVWLLLFGFFPGTKINEFVSKIYDINIVNILIVVSLTPLILINIYIIISIFIMRGKFNDK
jgi:hypothetical protein